MSERDDASSFRSASRAGRPRFLVFDEFRVDTVQRRLWRGGEPIHLTSRVFELLLAFLDRPGELLERQELLESVWRGRYVEDGNLTQSVFVLRRKLGAGGDSRQAILTEPGVGYRFVRDVRPEPIEGERTAGADAVPPADERPVDDESPRGARSVTSARIWPAVAVAAGVILAATVLARLLESEPGEPADAGPLTGVESLAVLPFVDLETNRPTPLGLGISDALVARLGASGSLVIRPLPTVLDYFDPALLPADLGRRLDVQALLVGTVLEDDGRLHASAQLIDVRDGRTLWAESFDHAGDQARTLHDDVVERVSRAFVGEPRYGSISTRAGRGTERFEAYESLMIGRLRLSERSAESLEQARAAFLRATRLDPRYAAAWAGLADAEFLLGFYRVGSSLDGYVAARDHALRAVEIDPGLAVAYTVLGMFDLHVRRDLVAAEKTFLRAVELAPRSSRSFHWYSWYLMTAGRAREAEVAIDRAHELDPLSMIVRSARALQDLYLQRSETALQRFDAALAIRPDFGRGHLNRGLVLEEIGRLAESAGALERAAALLGDTDEVAAASAHLAFRDGRVQDWRRLVDRLEQRGAAPGDLAFAYVEARPEKALELLELAHARKELWSWILAYDPRLDPLRTEPRFQRMDAW